MYTVNFYEIFWIFSNMPVYKKSVIWCLKFARLLPNKIPLHFMWRSTLHLFSDIQSWTPRCSLTSHSDVSLSELCISSAVHSLPLLPALVMGFFFLLLCTTYHWFFSFFDRVWGSVLFLSAQCGWMLHCFKWRIVLRNLRDTAKSDLFKINSRDSCLDLAGI